MARSPPPAPPRATGPASRQCLRRPGGVEALDLRLDRYLFFIRLVKSRTLAQGLIEAGHVRVDGKHVAKTAEEVRVGSVIALPLRGQVRVLRVTSLPARRGPASEARLAYEEIDEGGGAT